MLRLRVGRHGDVGLLGDALLAVSLEEVFDDVLELALGDRPFLVADVHRLARGERERVHELALLDAGRVHLDPFEVQVPDRLDGHPRLEAGGGAVQRGVVEVDGEHVRAKPSTAAGSPTATRSSGVSPRYG